MQLGASTGFAESLLLRVFCGSFILGLLSYCDRRVAKGASPKSACQE